MFCLKKKNQKWLRKNITKKKRMIEDKQDNARGN